jgi:dsRNA-specific ribonuclease
MTRGNLRKRLERLECRGAIESNGVPADFWEALAGTISFDQMTPQTRFMIEPLYEPAVNVDPLEEALRAAGLIET